MPEQRDEHPKVSNLMQALFDSVEKAKAEPRRDADGSCLGCVHIGCPDCSEGPPAPGDEHYERNPRVACVPLDSEEADDE